MKKLMTFVRLEKKEEGQGTLIEECQDYYEGLMEYGVYLDENSKRDLLLYIEQTVQHKRHCLDIFESQPAKVMQLLAKTEKISSYTEQLLMEKGAIALQGGCGEGGLRQPAKGIPLEMDYLPIQAIELPSRGNTVREEPLAELLRNMGAELQSSVLPFPYVQEAIHKAVSERSETYGGMQFVFLPMVREEIIETYKKRIIEAVSQAGGVYRESLWDVCLRGGHKTLKLSKAEWTMLCSLFRAYHAGVFLMEEGDLLLMVGESDA